MPVPTCPKCRCRVLLVAIRMIWKMVDGRLVPRYVVPSEGYLLLDELVVCDNCSHTAPMKDFERRAVR